MKDKKILQLFWKWYRGFCPCLKCAFDGDILVVKQRDVFSNALAQTFFIQIYNNAFVVSGDIALFRETNKCLAKLGRSNHSLSLHSFSHHNNPNRSTAKQQRLQCSLNEPLYA
jgi:hypothetical protein